MNQERLYGFFYNECTWESAASLISLHRLKRNAYKAMIAHQNSQWEDLKQHNDWCASQEEDWAREDKLPDSRAWFVREVEVLE